MLYFSKSKYCGLWQCPKLCWLKKYRPDLYKIDAETEAIFAAGNDVGDLAMGLFGDYTEVTELKGDGKLDFNKMITKTAFLVRSGADNICEASFSYRGLFCAVDILKKENGGYAIYEVKSSTKVDHIYCVDVAYQKYVLQKCGIKVTGTYIVNIDTSYVRQGELDIKKLFKITDISSEVANEEILVADNLAYAEKLLNEKTEPNIDIGMHCVTPYDCGFWEYCARGIPKPSVFDLRGKKSSDKFGSYSKGVISFDDVRRAGLSLTAVQRLQVEYADRDDTYIDREKLRAFMDKITYPVYFLDFESAQLAVPMFDGARPYQQIVFQYSLHVLESEDGEVEHREYIDLSGRDPRRGVAESLCENIPENACVLVYNKTFECTRLEEFAALYPDLADRLLKIRFNIIDLYEPFAKGYCYNRAMCYGFSIKNVLPALFPDDPSASYSSLDGIKNGSQAKDIYPKAIQMPPAEKEEIEEQLLKYCALDTQALLRLFKKLKNI